MGGWGVRQMDGHFIPRLAIVFTIVGQEIFFFSASRFRSVLIVDEEHSGSVGKT